VLHLRGEWPDLWRHWRPIAAVGLTNAALPFICFAYASKSLSVGLLSIFNASTALFAALIAWIWLAERLGRLRVLGLVIGFAGVFGLAVAKSGLLGALGGVGGSNTLGSVGGSIGLAGAGGSGSVGGVAGVGAFGAAASTTTSALAVAACLAATLSYGFSVSITKKYLTGVAPMAIAAGSLLAGTAALALPAWLAWPTRNPALSSWLATLALAAICTGWAYAIFFKLIARIGPTNAIAVTFLVPAFAVAWGVIFLSEAVTPAMLVGCAVIFAGTALATGVLPRRTVASVASGGPA
jgi:drug/metabolite transporter (DMT)-like permease